MQPAAAHGEDELSRGLSPRRAQRAAQAQDAIADLVALNPPVTLETQIRSVKRAIMVRNRSYGREVIFGHFTILDAAREILAMKAVLATLEKLQRGGAK